MWTLRRASTNSFKSQGLNQAVWRASAGPGSFSSHIEDNSSNFDQSNFMLDRWVTSETSYFSVKVPNRFSVVSRSLSSQAGAKSGGEEEYELEDGFSELETQEVSKTSGGGDEDSDSSSVSESELSEDDETKRVWNLS